LVLPIITVKKLFFITAGVGGEERKKKEGFLSILPFCARRMEVHICPSQWRANGRLAMMH
jgi:hypothetical protein